MSNERPSNLQADDLDAAMRRLIDQELMAQANVDVKSASEPCVTASDPLEPSLTQWRAEVAALASRVLKISPDRLDARENMSRYGVDSIIVTEIMKSVSDRLDAPIAPTVFFEAKHLEELADILFKRFRPQVERAYAFAPATDDAPASRTADSSASEIEPEIAEWMARYRDFAVSLADDAPKAKRATGFEPVAIIAMDGVFPQSPDLEAFEAHLANGDDCISEVPPERWDWREVYGDPKQGEFTNVRYGGFAPDIDKFDPLFFGISPREAEMMDPQHRLFMQCVWRVIEGAGYAPRALAGRKIGLFIGVNLQDYAHLIDRSDEIEALHLTSLGHMFCPNRLSFLLDVHGPSQVIDTACSSSLVALHRAVLAVQHEGCDMAVAGGANLMITPDMHIMYSKVGIICEDGRCKTFSPEANGYARADGVGAVLVKTLARAEADGDPILAVIRGSSENHGGMATSLTAPNPKAQASLIVEAHRRAGVDPRSIGYIECHGTGTALGDPIEINGLKLAFEELYEEAGLAPADTPHCGLGSVKSNIGHAETAAGIAGVIKAVLSLQRARLYRTLHCASINPMIDLDGSPFFIVQNERNWPRVTIDGFETPRRAGVSSFGAGGSNAHVLIEEYVAPVQPLTAEEPALIVLSARTREQLATVCADLLRHVTRLATASLAEIAYTLQVGRDAQSERVAFVANSLDHLRAQLERLAHGETLQRCWSGRVARRREASQADAAQFAIARRDLEELAALWVGGSEIGWSGLHAAPPRRVTLPTYPFARQRCWLAQAGGDRRHAPRKLHPLLGENTSRLDAVRFTTQFSGSEFFLADHVAMGAKVLPGAAYLEMARAAVALAHGGVTPARLRNVVWARPYIADASPEPIHVELRALDGRIGFRILSDDASGEILHGQGAVILGQAEPAPRVNLAALRGAMAHEIEGSACYQALAAMGMNYGPAHQGLRSVLYSGEGTPRQALARIELPHTLATGAKEYVLHPALIDAALQACVGLVAAALHPRPLADARDATASLPFALDELVLFAPPPQRLWVHVRPANASGAALEKLDLDLIDDDGVVCVRLSGFSSRPSDPQKPVARDDNAALLLCRPVWREALLPTAAMAWPRRHVVICDWVSAFPATLEAEIERLSPGARCTRLTLSAPLEQAYAEAVAAVFDVLRDASGRNLIQALVPAGDEGAALMGLAGLLQTARRENSQTFGQVIACGRGSSAHDLADRLARSAAHPENAQLRWIGASCEVLRWEDMAAPAPSAAPWKDNGVYLITGGAGGLGRLFARDIARRTSRATVVLCGRSPKDDAVLNDLRALGLNAHYRVADVSLQDDVDALVSEIVARHGRIDGVLHAAGLLRDNFLRNKSRQEIAAVLAPKVAGVLHLDRATASHDLDVFLLFASAAGAWGSAGQGDYAAANAFLDALAYVRNARIGKGERSGNTIAIDWPLWSDGGMRMEENALALMKQTTGMAPLPEAQGFAALNAIVASGATQVMPLYGAPEKLRQLLAAQETPRTADAPPAAPVPQDMRIAGLADKVTRALKQFVTTLMKFDLADVEAEGEWNDYGFDSLSLTDFANRLNQRYGLDLTPTVFFEHATIAALGQWLARDHAAACAKALGLDPQPIPAPAVAPETPTAPPSVPTPEISQQPRRAADDDAIAIVGVSAAFPMARDADEFWRKLLSGADCIGEIPADRWDWRAIDGDGNDRTRVRWGGFIDGVGDFDASFFGISPREAATMDPAQRLLLEHVWRVIEDAGHSAASLSGSNTGVFIGTAPSGYGEMMAQSEAAFDSHGSTGAVGSIGPNRVSYFLNLRGPSEPIETACSSALVALHRGVVAIQAGDCDQAIVGGVNLILRKETQISFDKAGMLSPDGRCKTFSAEANGYVRAEGVGLVFLKRLSAAERDRDHIYALIRGSGVNHGGRAKSLTAPNPRAQADLIEATWRRAGVDPRTASYIETHGSGTALGDPIEIAGLTTAFAALYRGAGAPTPETAHCALASVKSNIGHAELAAGVAGLVKTLWQFKHRTLVASLHCQNLNPHIRLEGTPFHILRENRPWTTPTDAHGNETPRRAGVSSFGFGGVNAHVVLEEYPQRGPTPDSGEPQLIVLSAKSEAALKNSARALLAFIAAPSAPDGAQSNFAARIAAILADCLGVAIGDIDAGTPFDELGVEPIHRAILRARLERDLARVFDAAPFQREATVAALAKALAADQSDPVSPAEPAGRRLSLADLAFTLQVGRDAMDMRVGFVARTIEETAAKLSAFIADGAHADGLHVGSVRSNKALANLFADDAFQAALTAWIGQGRFDRLLEIWSQGVEIDWFRLHDAGSAKAMPRRIALPGYPFARKRFWLAGDASSAPANVKAPKVDASPSVLHPLLHEDLSTPERISFRTRFSGREFFLVDHKVQGRSVLPGVAYLEMAQAAAQRVLTRADGDIVCISDVVWLRPAMMDADAALAIDLMPQANDALRYRVTSQDGAIIHSEGALSLGRTAQPPRLDIAALIGGGQRHSRAASECYMAYVAAGIAYGPAHRPLTALHVGGDAVMAQLDLPASVSGTLAEFVLHPSMLDGALQACIALAGDADGGLALPFAVEAVEIFRSCTTRMWAYVRPALNNARNARIRKVDIDLADADGNVCVAIRGFTTRLITPTTIAAPATTPVDAERLGIWTTEYFRTLLADTLKFEPAEIDQDAPLESFGIDSMLIMELTAKLEQKFGPVSKTLFFENDTVADLVDHFIATHRDAVAMVVASATQGEAAPRRVQAISAMTEAPDAMPARHAPGKGGQSLDIAIIGLSGRYPMARDVEEFWRNLRQGRDCITEVPIERWDWRAYYSDDSARPGRHSCKWGGFVPDADKFDPLFFNISPSAAEYMDPQERIFLEHAFAALEDAGYRRDDLQQRAADDDLPAQIGVYAGVMYGEYQFIAREASLAGHGFTTASFYASIANRVSYALNLHGPSLSVDTMCSSSLTAIHLACQDLTLGRTDMALAGGVNLNLHPNKYEVLSTGQFISPHGRCESFGAGGDGYVPSEGVGVVVLKRLADAERDGDHIYGVVKGSALNHGGRTNGYSVPNPNAQQMAIARAMREAHVDTRQLGYIEAHGTGTSLGDPIEIAGLAKALGTLAAPGQNWWIGSCKSNIGHCEGAAGMAGLTKILLQMREGKIAPSIHAETLNPNIDFNRAPFRVNTELRDWPRPIVDGRAGPRLASVSSFGAGGSNAHLVVEEYVGSPRQPPQEPRGPLVFPLSARTQEQLRQRVEQLAAALMDAPEHDAVWLRDVAFTLQTGREAMPHRVAATAANIAELRAKLLRYLSGDTHGLNIGRAATRPVHMVEPAGLTPAELAARFAAGDEFNWRALYRADDMPTRCSLPTYPFARERYWIDRKAPVPPSPAPDEPDRITQSGDEIVMLAPEWRGAPSGVPRSDAIGERHLIASLPLPHVADASVTQLVSAQSDVAAIYADYAEQVLALLRRILGGRPKTRILLQFLATPGTKCPPDIAAALAAMLKVAQQENPLLAWQAIETDSDAPLDLIRLAAAEARCSDAHIRYRNGRRESLNWETAPATIAQRAVWKEGGVYLITGGAGGLGLIFARHIAQSVKGARLILTGRSQRPSGLEALKAFSATVEYRSVDVADSEAVRALINAILRDHGALDGIIHSAGLLRDGYILKKTAEDLRSVLAAKVAGLMHLDDATRALDLDFFALFASLSGVAGNAGQADYAAANAFMDAYAQHRNAQDGRRRFLSLDWPLWAEGGMNIDPQAKDMMWRAAGLRPLDSVAGLRAFEETLSGALGQVLVLQGDGARLRSMAHVPSSKDEAAPPEAQATRVSAGRLVMNAVSVLLKLPESRIEGDVPLEQYGVDSVMMMKLTADLEQHVGPLPKTLLFEYPTVDALSAHLSETRSASFVQQSAPTDRSSNEDREPSLAAPTAREPDVTAPSEGTNRDIAIIGMSGRFPGARDLDELWTLLASGGDAITEVPPERWSHADYFDAARGKPGKTYCKWGGFIDDVDRFDARFFRIQPAEAALLDPQERLFLETVWNLLETSGCMGETLAQQTQSQVGVYVGSMSQQYHAIRSDFSREALVALSSPSSIANRVSYFFNFQGPSLAVDTMCSSALVALHMACDGLLRGDCRMAIAGGVNLTIHPKKFIALSLSEVIASRPESRSFADGDGYLPAEGVGAVLLKPLSAALSDGDDILGVIKSTAINHSGGTSGYRSPSPSSQADLIARNFERAGIDPRSVSYVESSSNGSPLGDAIEVRAQIEGFRRFTEDTSFCAIGAVKSNIGHAEAASGMSQMIKVLLQLKHGQLAPTIGVERLNPNISFEGSPFVLQRNLTPWRRPVVAREDGAAQQAPRRATVSALGLGGSGAHVIIEEYAERATVENPPDNSDRLFLLSAKTPLQLEARAQQLRDYVTQRPDTSLAALAYTLQMGRDAMDCRLAFVARDRDQLLAALSTALGEGSAHRLYRSPDSDANEARRAKVEDAELAQLLVTRDFARLASLWVNGARIAWSALWAGKKPRRLSLPPYPFERERHWLSPAPAERSPDQLSQDAMRDPPQSMQDDVRGYLAQFGDVKKSFQDLGVDSIGANVMRRDLERLFGLSLSTRDLVLHPTPEALASYAETLKRTEAPKAAQGMAASADAPLTHAQNAIYALHQYDPQTSAYNVPLALRLDDGVSADIFAAAFESLLRRFPELTTVIAEVEGEPRQSLRPDASFPLEYERLGRIDDALMRDLLRSKARQPFDLSAGQLARACFIESAHGNYGLIVVHHIIFDGASAMALLSALAEAIHDLRKNREPVSVPASARFSEYARMEAEFLASPAAESQLDYWRARLAGELPATAIPLDRARGAGPRVGATHRMTLPPPLAEAARLCARDLRINLSALYLGAFALLLSRYAGQAENIVVMPATTRRDPRFASCLGYFVNMIAIRSRIDAKASAREFLRATQLTLADALDNSDYPFPALRDALNLSRDADGAFDTLFAFQSFGREGAGELPFSLLSEIGQEATHDLALEVYDDGRNVNVYIGYAAELFDAAAIERFGAYYAHLIGAISRAPDAPLRNMQLVTPEERGRLLALAEGGAAKVDASLSIVSLFRQQARRTPDAPALIVARKTISYRKLDLDSGCIAAQLQASGVRPGDRVATIMERGADMVVGFLGILKAGAVHVPLAPDLPPKRLRALIKDCGAAVALTQKAHLDLLPKQIKALTVKKLRRRKARQEPSIACAPESPAYIIYTSGTTGTPKGVVVSHGAISHHCQVKRRIYALTPKDRVLLFAPMSVDASLDQLLPGLVSGAAIFVRPAELWSAREFRRAVGRLGLTAVDLPPAYLHEILASSAEDREWRDLASLRLVVSGGEALPARTVRLLRDSPLRGVRLINAYGPTEATVDSLLFQIDADTPEEAIGDDIAIGRPLPGESAYIFDSVGDLAPVGVPGELHIGGVGLALGYLNAPELTAEKFIAHPFKPGERLYKTGDRARWRADGVVSFLGRRDAQAKLRGYRVETGEVEAELRAISGVRQAAAQVLVKDGETRLVAYVAGDASGDLRRTLARRLPEHMIPSAIVHVDSLPLTAGGKIDRLALSRLPVDLARQGEPPCGAIEIRLAALWAAVLNRGHVGRRDNFFDLGGNSLLAVKLVSLIRREFGRDMRIAALLETPNIAGLALRLEGKFGAAPGDGPPLFVVPPAGGALAYREVAALLPGRSVHVLQAQRAKTIEALAADYVAELRHVQPRGPYRLAGWSAGGVIAYEMARQLIAAGDSVARLALIDSYTPGALRRIEAARGDDRKTRLPIAFAIAAGLAEHEARRILKASGGARDVLLRALPGVDLAEARQLYRTYERHAKAMDRYAPAPLALRRAVLFRASDGPQDDHGWLAVVDGLRVHASPGDHFSMLRAPHAAALAHKLGEFLDDND